MKVWLTWMWICLEHSQTHAKRLSVHLSDTSFTIPEQVRQGSGDLLDLVWKHDERLTRNVHICKQTHQWKKERTLRTCAQNFSLSPASRNLIIQRTARLLHCSLFPSVRIASSEMVTSCVDCCKALSTEEYPYERSHSSTMDLALLSRLASCIQVKRFK